ncbi:MAG: DUF2190 family protein [Phycisphaerales bacterium]|nr:DUF2190 family protein [Phycisphaerales bacterium]
MSDPQVISFTVAAGQSVAQHQALTLDSGLVRPATLVTDVLIGVAQDSAEAGESVGVAIGGISKAIVNGLAQNIVLGDELSCSTVAGRFVKHNAAGGTRFVAKALEPSSADGDVIWVQIYPYQPQQ